MNELDQYCACARGHENFGFVVHGPQGGRISLLDLSDPDAPTEIGVFPENGMPPDTGAADISVTRDGTFALVSNGLANPSGENDSGQSLDRVINILDVNLGEATPIQRMGFVEIGIPANDPNVLSMGVTISEDDRFAFTANVNNRSLTAFDIMEAENFFAARDNMQVFQNTSSLNLDPYWIQDVKQIPNTDSTYKLLVTFTDSNNANDRGVKVVDFSGFADGGALPLPSELPTLSLPVDPTLPEFDDHREREAKAIAIRP